MMFVTAPLMPLTTLRELRRLRKYRYLPDPEELLSKRPEGLEGFSDKMKRVLRTALLAQRTGSRRVFEQEMEELLARTATELELADYNVTQLYQLGSLFTSVIPVTVVSVLIFTSLASATSVLLGCAAITLVLGVTIAFGIYPRELAVPAPPLKSLIAAFPIPIIYLILYILGGRGVGVENPLLLSVATGSALLSLVHWMWVKRVSSAYREARELVRRAGTASYNVYAALGIENPEYLLDDKWTGIAGAATASLYMLCLYGGEKLADSLQRLEAYVGEYLDAFVRLREKTRTMMFYALLEASVVSVMYAILVACLYFMSGDVMGGGLEGFEVPTHQMIEEFARTLDPVLLLNALGLAATTAASREGNPALLTLYLPMIAATMWAGYKLGLVMAPQLLGGGV